MGSLYPGKAVLLHSTPGGLVKIKMSNFLWELF
jgi:hypothetical protein